MFECEGTLEKIILIVTENKSLTVRVKREKEYKNMLGEKVCEIKVWIKLRHKTESKEMFRKMLIAKKNTLSEPKIKSDAKRKKGN